MQGAQVLENLLGEKRKDAYERRIVKELLDTDSSSPAAALVLPRSEFRR